MGVFGHVIKDGSFGHVTANPVPICDTLGESYINFVFMWEEGKNISKFLYDYLCKNNLK